MAKLGTTLIAAKFALVGLLSLLLVAGIVVFDLPAEFATISTSILAVVALASFATSYGVYNLESWGWYAAVIISVCAFLASLSPLNVLGLIIPGIIIGYMWDNQKEYDIAIKL